MPREIIGAIDIGGGFWKSVPGLLTGLAAVVEPMPMPPTGGLATHFERLRREVQASRDF